MVDVCLVQRLLEEFIKQSKLLEAIGIISKDNMQLLVTK